MGNKAPKPVEGVIQGSHVGYHCEFEGSTSRAKAFVHVMFLVESYLHNDGLHNAFFSTT